MLIKKPRDWDLPEGAATPEQVYADRRKFIKSASAALAVGALPLIGCDNDDYTTADVYKELPREPDPTADLYPVERNSIFKAGEPTSEFLASTYNNFIEFGSFKGIFRRAQNLRLRPWDIRIEGEVEKPFTLSIDDLIRKMPLEERVYRHRCVETWAMVVPWSGFPLRKLVELARPLSHAKYVQMETFLRPQNGQWPTGLLVSMALYGSASH